MKARTYLIFAIAWLGCFLSAAQPNAVVPTNIRASNTLDKLSDGISVSESLWGIPLEPGRVLGTTYLTEGWNRATILLYDDRMIEGYLTRYEIDLDQIEIRLAAEIKVLDGKLVRSFVWTDEMNFSPHYFVNARDYRLEGQPSMTGFFEVLSEGPVTLLSKTDIAVRKPSYNVALDMGVRDTRLVQRTDLYYLKEDLVRELPSSKKKLMAVFGENADDAEAFIKSNKLSLNDESNLKVLFDHINEEIMD